MCKILADMVPRRGRFISRAGCARRHGMTPERIGMQRATEQCVSSADGGHEESRSPFGLDRSGAERGCSRMSQSAF